MEAVYYEIADHLGVWRRLFIDVVDMWVVLFVWLVATMIANALMSPSIEAATLTSFTIFWIACVLYYVVLKGSRFRTLGYFLAGAKIVDFRGERPGWLALLLRLTFILKGPANILFDLVWVSSDPGRQALRDKVAHTYVVRKDAVPAGRGRITYPVYNVFGWTLMFAEVRPRA